MKKAFIIALVVVFCGGTLYAQEILGLDDVISRSAKRVEEVLPEGALTAVLSFSSPSLEFSNYVIEELTGALVNGRKITVVDRQNLALVSQEMNLQLSGDVSDESAQAIGKMLGARSIILGSLTRMASYYRFMVRVINVETAAIEAQVSLNLRNDEQVAFLLGGSPGSALSVTETPPPVVTAPEPAPSPVVSAPEPAPPPAVSAASEEPDPPEVTAAPEAEAAPESVPEAEAAYAKNWFSVQSGGYTPEMMVRYERMLGSKFSLGLGAYWLNDLFSSDPDPVNVYGIEASFRWYPWDKGLFLGAALGYYYSGFTDRVETWGSYTAGFAGSNSAWQYLLTEKIYAMTIGGELGWRIDFGEAGGVYIELGLMFNFPFGTKISKGGIVWGEPNFVNNLTEYEKNELDGFFKRYFEQWMNYNYFDGYKESKYRHDDRIVTRRFHIGLGWAF